MNRKQNRTRTALVSYAGCIAGPARRMPGLWIACLLGAAACTRSSPIATSSESHFLVTCDGSCAEGTCMCGTCTDMCSSDDQCLAMSADARCLEPLAAASCEPDAPARVCDVPCSSSADCASMGSEFGCSAGRCRQVGRAQDSSARADASADFAVDASVSSCGPSGTALQACPSVGADPPSRAQPAPNADCDPVAAVTQPLSPREGETCYEFPAHALGAIDQKFTVAPGESYTRFYYDVPWPAATTATRFGARFDDVAVLHHYLVLDTGATQPAGSVVRDTADVTQDQDAALLASWQVGGCHLELPADVALDLPEPGRMIAVAWHYFNATGAPQLDGSAVEVCTVPDGTRARLADVTWVQSALGNDGASTATQSSLCRNTSSSQVTLLALWTGLDSGTAQTRTAIVRADGTREPVFEQPLDPGLYNLDPARILAPGDGIASECSFPGRSTLPGSCDQFVLAYPAGVLGTAAADGMQPACAGE